jgi:hypothetical protein
MCTVTVQIHRHFSDRPLVTQIYNRSHGAFKFSQVVRGVEFDLPIVYF